MPVDHTKNIVEVRDVSFSYGGTPVLEHISLNIHKGDYLGIIGPNGGGKTTLLRVMLGLLKPDKGSVRLFGEPIESFRNWATIGYVPQKAVHFEANFPVTVREVVEMGRFAHRGMFKRLTAEDHAIVDEVLEQVEMQPYKDRVIGDLSGGQQQRVFIARALATQPQVIFLDEPTVGIDINAQEEFYNLLKKLNTRLSITLVLISHDIDVVAHETTEIACVNKTLIYDSDPKDFLKNDGLKALYGRNVKFILHNH